jgi:hypothetical protein
VDHPEQWWSTILEPNRDRLSEAIDDLGDSIVRIDYRITKTGPAAELVGITSSLMALHDVLQIYGDIGISPPDLFIATQKTLAQRLDDLRQGQTPEPQP